MENKKTEGVGFFDSIGIMIKGELEKRRGDSTALLFDAVVLIVSFLFARCHIVFGAYPLGVAFVAVMPRGVWISLIGSVAGALSLGKAGVIHAIISIIVVFLRVIISGGEKRGEGALFCEPLILRISAASIGAFVGAAYEVLLGGFAFKSVMYGVVEVLLSAVFTFCFAGILDTGISFSDFLSSRRNIFKTAKSEKDIYGIYLFQGTFLLFVFLISLALRNYNVLGISPAYMFSVIITLVVARRFGAIRAMAVGFVSSLGISSIFSAAFALVGLGAGLLFGAGVPYALIGGGVLLSLWSAYAGGTVGFLSTFPEYVTGALLCFPILRKLSAEPLPSEKREPEGRDARDMVAATALAYRNSSESFIAGLSDALAGIGEPLRIFGEGEGTVTYDEYKDLVIKCASEFCRSCHHFQNCVAENPAPCAENIDLIATKLYKNERLFPDDITISPKYCHNAQALFEHIMRSAAFLEEERFKNKKMDALAEEYELFAKLIREVHNGNEKERCVDMKLSEKLTQVFSSAGMHNGIVRVLGDRCKHFIGAGEDKDGRIITSPELRREIEEEAGVRLGTPEYYRKGDVALLEVSATAAYAVEFATAGRCSVNEKISGDTAISFETADGRFYSLISDGMGSGEVAHKTSVFASDFLSKLLNSSCTKSTAFHILNHIIRDKGEECSASIDLFEFDLITGEGIFFKCGAAASYVKREGSIFRVRSETAPLGLMKNIDAERIRVEVRSGDYIIMLSDGVSQSTEDSTWLLELLNKPPRADIRDYADYILSAAINNSKTRDDMSVSVARIVKLGEQKYA